MRKENAMTEVKEAPKAKIGDGRQTSKQIVPGTSGTPLALSDSPFAVMRRFAREMNHLFEDFGLDTGWLMPRSLRRGRRLLERELAAVEWSPRVDVIQREGQLVIRADLPGLNTDDIKVEVTDDVITIEGERKHEKKEEREGYHCIECSYGSFYRSIPLPESAEVAKAAAEFMNGVLEVTVPAKMHPEPKARRLEVKERK
jgi:HSP20 family protein